jgi:hypothetical protein
VAILTAIISFFLADAGWGAIPLAAVGFPATVARRRLELHRRATRSDQASVSH